MLKELEDRFGPPPAAIQNLLDYALLKAQAEKMAVAAIERRGPQVSLKFHPQTPVKPEKLVTLLRSRRGTAARSLWSALGYGRARKGAFGKSHHESIATTTNVALQFVDWGNHHEISLDGVGRGGFVCERIALCPDATTFAIAGPSSRYPRSGEKHRPRPDCRKTGNSGSRAAPIQGTVVEDIVARVNDDIVTTVDYQEALANAPQEAQDECQGCSAEQLAAAKAEVQKNVLRDLIDQALLVQRAKDLGITVETDVVKELDRIRQENNKNNSLPDLESLEKEIESQGINYDDFKNKIRDHILVQEVIRREVQSKINLDHAKVVEYYNQHKAEFESPEMVYLREIFVSTKGKPEAEVTKLK